MLNILKSIFKILKSIILSLILVCLVVFMVNNRETASVHLYPLPFEIETKVFLVMLTFFVLGMVFGILSCSQTLIGKMIENFNDRRRIKHLEKQVGK